jgi:hypothetical protein
MQQENVKRGNKMSSGELTLIRVNSSGTDVYGIQIDCMDIVGIKDWRQTNRVSTLYSLFVNRLRIIRFMSISFYAHNPRITRMSPDDKPGTSQKSNN